jgi:Cof subfamily protein (haloacid dehalogenase superfamily)
LDIKLIALDMDGTVLKDDKNISKKTVEALRAAQERGILIVPATGRPKKMIPERIFDVGAIRYAITSNGACVYDLAEDSVFYSNLMTEQESTKLIDFLSGYDLFVEAYCDGGSFTDEKSRRLIASFTDFPQLYIDMIMKTQTFIEDMPGFLKKGKKRVEKVNIPYMDPHIGLEVHEKLSGMKEYALTSSFLQNIEINRASANKGEALGYLCQSLGIQPEQVMAFGDGSNDIEMLQFAGMGVAMQNAIEPLKPIANFITRSNQEDGVAYAIEQFILN